MLLMLEKGIRGGICQVITPFAKANNKYLKKYDKSIPSSFLKYYDANNLHGGAMCKKFPFKNFDFVDPNYYDEDLIMNYNEYKNDHGAILEVDIECPKDIALKHEDIAFLPEKRKINGVEKLITTLEDKKKICCTYISFKRSFKSWFKVEKGL